MRLPEQRGRGNFNVSCLVLHMHCLHLHNGTSSHINQLDLTVFCPQNLGTSGHHYQLELTAFLSLSGHLYQLELTVRISMSPHHPRILGHPATTIYLCHHVQPPPSVCISVITIPRLASHQLVLLSLSGHLYQLELTVFMSSRPAT
jgi:hypothetical protein